MKKIIALALALFITAVPLYNVKADNSGNPGNNGNNPTGEISGGDESESGGEVTVETVNPNGILTDPNFDLSSVDPGVLEAWYQSEVNIPDATLKKALMDISGAPVITVKTMLDMQDTLNLNNLGITNLTGLEYAINLKTLHINNNSLASLEPIKNLYKLESLDYSYNNVRLIPSWLFSMPSLVSLNGCNNLSTVFPSIETTESHVTDLYLEGNELDSLPSLSALIHLKVLSLANNNFTVFPQSILSLPSLEMLYLSNNKITDTPNLSPLVKVSVLNLDGNFMTEFPLGLENLKMLDQLSLQNNDISVIPDNISSISKLSTLILYANDIKVLPESLIAAKQLKVLDIGLNDIDLEENAAVIKGLNAQLNVFYYTLQNPHFILEISKDSETSMPKLTWSGIADVDSPEEGYYKVTKFVIERKEETIETEQGGDKSETGDKNEDVISDDNSGVKPTISVFEVINELEPFETEYVDTTADPEKHYTYKVTAHISGLYMDNYVIDVSGSESINTSQIGESKIIGNQLFLYIGIGIIVVAGFVGALLVYKRNKKKPLKVREIKPKADISEDITPKTDDGDEDRAPAHIIIRSAAKADETDSETHENGNNSRSKNHKTKYTSIFDEEDEKSSEESLNKIIYKYKDDDEV